MMGNKLNVMLWKSLNKQTFFTGMVLSLVSTVMGLFLPQFIGKLLDQTYLTDLLANPSLLMGFALFFLMVYGAQGLSSYLLGRSGSQSLMRLQQSIYSSLLKSSIAELDHYQAGDIASRLTNDISVILNFITVVLPGFFMNILLLVASVCLLWNISLPLTLVSLVAVPLLTLVMLPIGHKLENNYSNYQASLGEISGCISHKFTHIRLMKAFQGEKVEQDNMAKSFNRLATGFEKIIKLSVIQQTLVSSLLTGSIILILLMASVEVMNGAMTIATLTTFILYLMQLIEPVTELTVSINEWTEYKSVSSRLLELIELSKEHSHGECYLPTTDIQLKQVYFSYDNHSVLEGLSFSVPEGKHLALVGPSGAGKSTIFSLLMKFYQDYQGEILIGGQPLHSLSAGQMRNIVSYIPQDNTLFQGTIRENLLYGKNEGVSDQRLMQVLKELDLLRVVDGLENGLNTVISDSGIGLSEGQKQRFGIARALLLEHPIYLMDEITASLDSITEHKISEAVDRLTEGKTRITIAHRLHMVRKADAILVLDKDGKVVDYGNHQELAERSSFYQDLLQGMSKAS